MGFKGDFVLSKPSSHRVPEASRGRAKSRADRVRSIETIRPIAAAFGSFSRRQWCSDNRTSPLKARRPATHQAGKFLAIAAGMNRKSVQKLAGVVLEGEIETELFGNLFQAFRATLFLPRQIADDRQYRHEHDRQDRNGNQPARVIARPRRRKSNCSEAASCDLTRVWAPAPEPRQFEKLKCRIDIGGIFVAAVFQPTGQFASRGPPILARRRQ